MNRMFLRAAALCGVIVLAGAGRASANCGAEGCPLSPGGLEGAGRRWTLDVGYQYVSQDVVWDGSGKVTEPEPVGHITELFTKTSSYTLNGRARVMRSLVLTGSLPYIQRKHAHELQHHPGYFVPTEWQYEGLGDAMLTANWQAFGTPEYGIGAFSIQAGAKLPTGVTEVPEVDGEQPEPPARPGTGSTDGIAGLGLVRNLLLPAPGGRSTTVPLVLTAMGRWNGEGTDGYRVGDELQVSLSSVYGALPHFSVLAQVNFLSHGKDDVGNTDAEPHHTGGQSLFATPGLRVALPGSAALYGYWQLRIYEHTNGPQLVAPDHLIFGASFGLGN